MAIGRYAGIAGIEDFINAGDSPDYYDMYLNAGNVQSDLDNLALASGGEMSIGAMNALSKFYDGVAQSKILEQKAGTKEHPLNTALNIGSKVAGFIPGGGGGSGANIPTSGFGSFQDAGSFGSISGYTPSFSGSLF
tara:strand:+ start:57 stop:464 length:408 start_codon:yes stop_codon:yes gene_type:complete